MSINEMDTQVSTYFDLLAQIKELEEQAEAIKDTIKGQMIEQSTEQLTGTGWSATWHNTQSSRFDHRQGNRHPVHPSARQGMRKAPCINADQSQMQEAPTPQTGSCPYIISRLSRERSITP